MKPYRSLSDIFNSATSTAKLTSLIWLRRRGETATFVDILIAHPVTLLPWRNCGSGWLDVRWEVENHLQADLFPLIRSHTHSKVYMSFPTDVPYIQLY